MSVADLAQGLTSAQRAVARVIEREFLAAGFVPEVAAAAIVNAIAESGLNPNAVGDRGASVGLFQLHERGGGAGMSVEERKDPVKNTRRIIREARRAHGFMWLVGRGVRDLSQLASAFSTYVERPADKVGEAFRRAALAAKHFPTLAQIAVPAVAAATSVVAAAVPLAVPAAPVVAAVAPAAAVSRAARRSGIIGTTIGVVLLGIGALTVLSFWRLRRSRSKP